MELKDYCEVLPDAVAQIGKGAFLTAGGAPLNPMTIGWAEFGVVWGKPVATVLVRKSRFTYALLEKTDSFSISIPAVGTMADAVAYCGRVSGRDGDKLAGAGLTKLAARCGGADGVAGCNVHVECKIVFKQDLSLDKLDTDLRARYYGANQALSNGDPHVVYVGEVVGAYRE